MISIPARWSVVVSCVLMFVPLLGTVSCSKDHSERGDDDKKPRAQKLKEVSCDTDVDVDVVNVGKGVKKPAVYVCAGDTFTWRVPKGHTFVVVFKAGSPFTASNFSDQNPTAIAQSLYAELTVYKYSITVDSNPPVDPHVVTGGNP